MTRRSGRNAPTVSDQLRAAILNRRGETVHGIAVSAGIAPSCLSRFVSGQRGLTLDSLDALAELLGLRLVETARRAKAGPRGP